MTKLAGEAQNCQSDPDLHSHHFHTERSEERRSQKAVSSVPDVLSEASRCHG